MAKKKQPKKTEQTVEERIKEKRLEMDELASQGWENLSDSEKNQHEALAAEVAKMEAEISDGATDEG